MVSAPAPPFKVLLWVLPVSLLSLALPLNAPCPACAPKVPLTMPLPSTYVLPKYAAMYTVSSAPSAPVSVTTSPGLST